MNKKINRCDPSFDFYATRLGMRRRRIKRLVIAMLIAIVVTISIIFAFDWTGSVG